MTQRGAVRDGRPIQVDVPGFRGPVHTRVDGSSGPYVLLVHGFSGSMRWWDQVVPLITDRCTVVRVDLVGHGATGGGAVDAPVQAAAVDAVLAELELSGVTAVGHSFGADVAVQLAETSGRVDRLVIVTQAPDYSDANLPRGRMLMTVPVIAPTLHRAAVLLGKGAAAAMDASRRVLHRGPGAPDLADQALGDFAALDTGMFRVVLAERRDRMAARPLDEQVRAAGKPTLVILGGKDHFYGARSARRYQAAGARVEILPDSGHSPLVEQPATLATLLVRFCPSDRPDVR